MIPAGSFWLHPFPANILFFFKKKWAFFCCGRKERAGGQRDFPKLNALFRRHRICRITGTNKRKITKQAKSSGDPQLQQRNQNHPIATLLADRYSP